MSAYVEGLNYTQPCDTPVADSVATFCYSRAGPTMVPLTTTQHRRAGMFTPPLRPQTNRCSPPQRPSPGL